MFNSLVRNPFFLFGAAALVGVIALIVLGSSALQAPSQPDVIETGASEANEITNIKATRDRKQQEQWYRQLIERVGPAEAQEALYRSGLPFTGETHLLNHIAGDWLYEKYGVDGLVQCRDYFLSSCYHGFLLHIIGTEGIDGLPRVMDACRTQGVTTVTQCSHAIGHGLLTWTGYANIPKALEYCDQVAMNISDFPVYNCHDGIFMENIWAVHTGQPAPDRWVKPDDLFYPCNDPRIKEQYRQACWAEQPTIIYQQTGGDIKRVGEECLKVEARFRATCFDSLARQVHPLTEGSVEKTFSLCSLFPVSEISGCIGTLVVSAYSVGDRKTPFETCERANGDMRNLCFSRLIGIIKTYSRSPEERSAMCLKVSDAHWQQQCLR